MCADHGSPTSIAITGAAGALGGHLIRHLQDTGAPSVRALMHRTPLAADLVGDRVTAWPGSVLDPDSLNRWLEPGCTVIHLAYAASMSDDDQHRAIEHLSAACMRRQVRSVIHCSTAVVAGRTRARVVTEETPCEPATPYERAKYAIEEVFERMTRGRVPLVIARPTAIFGPGFQNLVALADSVSRGGVAHYLRASLFGRRQLHLVPVDTVVRALCFLTFASPATRFIISADTEPGGDFRSVEQRVRQALGLAQPRVPPAPLPAAALRLALRLAGRSDADPARIYDGSKLARAGFTPTISIDAAIDQFAAWYRAGRTSERVNV
jgi:nucleoside-diphosphate-sugar epimerase